MNKLLLAVSEPNPMERVDISASGIQKDIRSSTMSLNAGAKGSRSWLFKIVKGCFKTHHRNLRGPNILASLESLLETGESRLDHQPLAERTISNESIDVLETPD